MSTYTDCSNAQKDLSWNKNVRWGTRRCRESLNMWLSLSFLGAWEILLSNHVQKGSMPTITSTPKLSDRRKFRSQTSDNMDRWKAEQGRGREKRKIRRKKSRRERVRRKKMQMRLAKAAGAEPAGQTRDEKLHAVVARSTFRSQHVQNTPFSDHFWKLRCRKSARRCGAKHISKWKCPKHTMVGPLLEVEMWKKWTPLWREAHIQVKMHKTHHGRTTFGSWDVENVHAVVARSTFRSQNAQNTTCSRHFWMFRSLKSARPLWREAHFEVKMLKTFKNTRGSDHFCRFRCRFASLH